MRPLLFDESQIVAAPPAAIWRLLADATTWRTWWPRCLDARTKDRKLLHDGTDLVLLVRPSWLPLRFHARVEAVTEPKLVIWTSRRGGLVAQHSFHLEARTAAGTRVQEQLAWTGPAVVLLRLLGQVEPYRRMLRANLRGLKQLAERLV